MTNSAYADCVKCDRYYKDPIKSKDLILQEGWSPTGDVFEEREPGVLYWVDRVKNIFKLSQGEFVSLWRLEAFYSASALIRQVKLLMPCNSSLS